MSKKWLSKKDSKSFSDSRRSQAASVPRAKPPQGPGQALWLNPCFWVHFWGCKTLADAQGLMWAVQGSTGSCTHLPHWLPPSAGARKASLPRCLPCLHPILPTEMWAPWDCAADPEPRA